MNDVKVFEKSELGSIRVVGTKEQPLFCLRDVCDVLGIANNSDVKASIIKEFGYDLDLIYPISDNLGRTQQATFITEPQLYQEQRKGEIWNEQHNHEHTRKI